MGFTGQVQPLPASPVSPGWPAGGVLEPWGEWLASRSAGLLLIRGVDSVLRLVERTLMWSTQASRRGAGRPGFGGQADAGDALDTKLVVVERPLAWPLFLPLLGVLGVARVTVYYVTRVFRKPCDTSDMIYWLQCQRRRLRMMKNAGLRSMRLRQSEKAGASASNTPSRKKVSALAAEGTPEHERKRKYEDVEQSDWTDVTDDESAAMKLERYGEDYDSETDPDFVPSSDMSDDEGTTDSDCESDEDGIEDGEVAVLVNEADVPPANAIPTSFLGTPATIASPASVQSPSLVTVESPKSVSDYGKADAESPASTGSSVMTTPNLSPRSRFVKFFRRGSKTK